MSTLTLLNALVVSTAEQNNGAITGGDVAGMVSACKAAAAELVTLLNSIKANLPGGDPNIAIITQLVTNLS